MGVDAAAPCGTESHRAFDFWLGEWSVYRPDGELAGGNHIERGYDGCVIHERYVGAAGRYRGESLNIYDAVRGVWHQTWVDTTGQLLLLQGGLRDGRMVLEGRTTLDGGKIRRQRITWTPNADGSVRQRWEAADGDAEWRTLFKGLYRRE